MIARHPERDHGLVATEQVTQVLVAVLKNDAAQKGAKTMSPTTLRDKNCMTNCGSSPVMNPHALVRQLSVKVISRNR
jgi:hypothetical protein